MITFEISKYYYEKNACVVVALTEVSGEDYDVIHTFVRHVMNRNVNEPVRYENFHSAKNNIKKLGLSFKKKKISENENVESFALNNNIGKFLLFTEGHVSAMIDGVIKDSESIKNKQLIEVIMV